MTFSVEAAPQFLMDTADTLDAHAPGSITTFTSSDRETETQAHGCLGMTTHPPAPKKQCSTTLQDSDSRQSPARESQTLHTHPVISLHSCNTQCIPLHPQNSVERASKPSCKPVRSRESGMAVHISSRAAETGTGKRGSLHSLEPSCCSFACTHIPPSTAPPHQFCFTTE